MVQKSSKSEPSSRFFVRLKIFNFLKVHYLIVVLSSYVTPGPYFERTVRTSSKSLNGRKIARMAPILTIFGPNRSRRRDLFFEKFSNERRRHRRLVVVSSSPSSSPSSPPSSPQHNYSRSQLPRTTIRCFFGFDERQPVSDCLEAAFGGRSADRQRRGKKNI